MSSVINLTPIGRVEKRQTRTVIVIEPEFRQALDGLGAFSHINVIWWGHRSDCAEKRDVLKVRKPYKGGPEELGVFSTRSEQRPNPILITVVEAASISVEDGLIGFPYIDAEVGSPVLDLKPYIPASDRVERAEYSEWSANWPQCYEEAWAFDWDAVFNF